MEVINLINKIGFWNLFSIISFLIGTIYTTYTYFKSFYRIVYTYERICKTCHNIKDWNREDQNFITRIIFLNNGRKTLTKKEIKKIEISSLNIRNVRILESNSVINFKIINNGQRLEVDINFLDASDFFVLEFSHSSFINVNGRVAETGEFLHTETKGWLYFNLIFGLYFFVSMFFIIFNYNEEFIMMKKMGINLAMSILFYFLLRFIHKLFFISDDITAKYLLTKDKWNNEFKNEFKNIL